MDLADRVVDAIADLDPSPERVLEVGCGSRFDVARRILDRLDVALLVTDRADPDAPDALDTAAFDVERDDPPAPADVVLAVRPPPELRAAIVDVADRLGAVLVLCPLPEESPPDGFRHVAPGVHVRRP